MELQGLFKPLISPENKYVKEWKRQKRPVLGYSCSYTPEEIIHAGRILPIRVLGSLDPPRLADIHLPVNVCSFAKSCLNNALKNEYSFLDGYVASNSCDNQNKIYDFWRHCTTVRKTYFLNTPHSTTERALKFFCEELERFREWLMEGFQAEISQEDLKNAITIFNQNRRLLRQVYELRKPSPPIVSGSEALEIVLSSMMTPKDEHNKLLHKFLDGMERHQNPAEEGVRLLVSGSVMGNPEVMRLIESVGGQVVADDLCTGSRHFWDLVRGDAEPMMAIAERYLSKIPCPFMYSSQERFEYVREMARLFDVEGVLIFSLKCCDVHSFDAPLLAEELRRSEDLPVLCLEWEHSLSGVAQLRTRIEAFVEMFEK